MSAQHNPSAFPSTWRVRDGDMVCWNGAEPAPAKGNQEFIEVGMTLRDYFAAKALQAEIITSTSDATPESADAVIEAAERAGRSAMDQIAFNAYQWADAMLKARFA